MKTIKIIFITLGVIILAIAGAGMYKFHYLSGQDGYDVDGNKTTISSQNIEETTNNTENEVSFLDTKVIFPTSETSKKLLSTSDTYTQGLSIFDIKAKTQNTNATGEVDYLAFAKKQAGGWTSKEIKNLKASIATAESKIKALGLKLNLPKIKIVKSTGLEEGGAAYTRGDYIVLTANDAASPNGAPLFLHELFHVYSRANPIKRDALYALLGFSKCNNIEYPDSLENRKMTNPDAPILEHCITLDFNGKKEDAVILLYANADYSSGEFFQYMTKKLLLLEGDSTNKKPKLVNGVPDVRAFDSASNLLTQIGNNTDYTLHPEEISAEHFRMLVLGETVKTPSFLNKMKDILSGQDGYDVDGNKITETQQAENSHNTDEQKIIDETMKDIENLQMEIGN